MAVQSVVDRSPTRRWRTVRALLVLNVVALVAVFASSHWDAAEHAKGAVDRFWYPPHFGIYFAILAAAVVSLAGLIVLLRAPGMPFDILRQNAALATIVVANGLSFTGAPFDAWWHTTFGIDLTVWSPPHLHLLLGIVLSALGCVVYFLDDAPVDHPLRLVRGRPDARHVLVFGTLLLALLMAVYLFVEYEGGARSRDVLRRPLWSYPVLWTPFVTFTCALVAASTRRIGAATLLAAAYCLARLGMIGIDRVVLNYAGIAFYPLLLPAIVFDLALIGAQRVFDQHRWLSQGVIGVLMSLVVALSTPLWWQALNVAPDLTVQPWRTYGLVALGSGVLGVYLGWWCGTALRRLRPTNDPAPDQVIAPPLLVR